jgi:hypothetical protein
MPAALSPPPATPAAVEEAPPPAPTSILEMLESLPPDASALEALHPAVRSLHALISGDPLPTAPPDTPRARMATYQLQAVNWMLASFVKLAVVFNR